MRVSALLCMLFLVAGCGDGSDDGFTYSCSWKDGSGSNAGTCLYYNISTVSSGQKEQVQQICTGASGAYAEGPCPQADIVGRCIQFEGTEGEVSYYYYTNYMSRSGDPKAAAQSFCSGLPGRWVDAS